MDDPFPGRDAGEIADPEHIGCRHAKLAVHLVQRAWDLLVWDRRPVRFAADDALDAHVRHQPCHRATRDTEEALPDELPPDLADAMDPPVLFENPPDLGPRGLIAAGTIRQA